MPYVMVNIEADSPISGDFSMVCFGAIIVDPELLRIFYGRLTPVSDAFIPEALAVSGFARDECLAFDAPKDVMQVFHDRLTEHYRGRILFISNSNRFDWQFINCYLYHFLGTNPFAFSSANLGSLYKGMEKDTFANFKHLRNTKHTHHPVDDARGNAEALLAMKAMGFKIKLSQLRRRLQAKRASLICWFVETDHVTKRMPTRHVFILPFAGIRKEGRTSNLHLTDSEPPRTTYPSSNSQPLTESQDSTAPMLFLLACFFSGMRK